MAKELWKGNEAIAEAAIRAGCKFFFGYPITPQTEVPEYLSLRLPEIGGCFLQAESEVAAINMVYGAAGCGVRVMTSSSSPGISLKQEGITYLCGAELPCVIINVMRGGPGLGTIQPAQGDYYQATRGGGNGDYRTPVLAPANVQEAADFVRILQNRQGITISAPEEIAYNKGWITREQLLEAAEAYGKSPYGKHLHNVADGKYLY